MAQYISVKRKQQTNKRAPLAIALCLLFLFSSLVIPSSVFAIVVDFDDTFVFSGSTPDYSQTAVHGLAVNVANSNAPDGYYTWYYLPYNTGSEYPRAYYAYYHDGSNITLFIFYYKDTTTSLYLNGRSAFSSNNSVNSFNFNRAQYYPDGSTQITFDDTNIQLFSYQTTIYSSSLEYNNISNAYDSRTSMLNDIVSFANGGFNDSDLNGGSSGITNGGKAIIVVNPGNVAYIGYDSATFNFLINLSKPVSSLNSNARYGFASELPNGVITFTPSSGNALPLRKSIPDLLGRSATWIGSVDTDTVGYFVVYNPVYDLNGNTNPPIRVTVTLGYMNVTQFPLTASDIGGDIVSTGNSDNFYISDGVQGGTDLPSYIYSQTDQNGNVLTSSALTVPVTPYNYTTPSTGNAESGLQGFIQQILDLLSAPIKLIQNLYDSAIGFFNYLTSLWSWLPPELTTIIISALGVLVVIGVVKFLWK